MNAGDNLGGYKPREYYVPKIEELWQRYSILGKNKKLLKSKNFDLINRRALRWLHNAAIYAHATLSTVINFFPDQQKPFIQHVINELSGVLDEIRDNLLEIKNRKHQKFKIRLLLATNAVAHAGNICNNWVQYFPEDFRKIVLETRDLCDEAVKQPQV